MDKSIDSLFTWGNVYYLTREEIYEKHIKGQSLIDLSKEYEVSYNSLKAGINRMKQDNASSTQVKKADKDSLELHKLRQEIAELKRRDKKDKNQEIGITTIIDAINKSIPRLNPKSVIPVVKVSKPASEQHIALLSDIHIGAVVDVDSTGGLAEYNYNTFLRRLYNYERGILSVKSKLYKDIPVNHLDIFALGDLVEGFGNIFDGQAYTLEKHVIDQCLDLAKELANLLKRLLDHYHTITYTSVIGNHGRSGAI